MPGIYADLRVLELGSGAASPVATRYFAAQGATVLRVESRVRPDFLRTLHLRPGQGDSLDAAPMFVLLNPDKQSVTLNLKRPEGAALVRRLALEWADVVSENFAPGVMERAGLAPAALHAAKPELIVISGCLFGQTGPQKDYPGFGGQGAAISGFNHLTGWADREALGPYGTITDSLSPRYLAVMIAAALRWRRSTGRGQVIDISQIETGVYSLSESIVRHSANGESLMRRGNHSDGVAPHAIYPCAGIEQWIAIACPDDVAWQALVDVLGSPGSLADPRFASLPQRLRHQDPLDSAVADATRERERDELVQALQAAGVEAGPVESFAELLEDPQLSHRDHFRRLQHAHLGEVHYEQPGFRLSRRPHRIERPAPDLGEHNAEVLSGILGLSQDEITGLIADSVVH